MRARASEQRPLLLSSRRGPAPKLKLPALAAPATRAHLA